MPAEPLEQRFLPHLRRRGITAELRDDGLFTLSPRDRLTEKIRQTVREHREEIIAELRAEVASVGTAGQEAPRHPTAQPDCAVDLHPAVENRRQQDLQAGEQLQPGFYVLESGIWRAMEEGRISETQAEEHFGRLFQSVDLFRLGEPQVSQSVAVGN